MDNSKGLIRKKSLMIGYLKKISLFFCFLILNSWIGTSQENWTEKAEQYLYVNQDSTRKITQAQYKIGLINKDWSMVLDALVYENETNYFHGNLIAFQASLKKQDSIFSFLSKTLDTIEKGLYHKVFRAYHKGVFYLKIGNYEDSRIHFYYLLNLLDEVSDSIIMKKYSEFITATNANIAETYNKELKYGLAESFYKENLRLHKKFQHSEGTLLGTTNLLAALKTQQKDYKTSNAYLNTAIDFYISDGTKKYPNSLMSCTRFLLDNYLQQKQLDSAQYYYKRLTPHLITTNKYYGDIQVLNAKIAWQLGNREESLALLKEREISLKKEAFKGKNLAELYLEIGKLYFSNKEYKTAQNYFNKALLYYKDKTNKNSNKTGVFEVIHQLCKTQNTMGVNYKNTLIETNFALEQLSQIQSSFINEKDKQILIENVLPIISEAIEACYQLYFKTQDETYLNTAFSYFEKSRSSLLLDALNTTKASKFAGISDALLEKEQILKLNISALEKRKNKGNKNSETELFQLKKEQEILVKELAKSHPKYYNLKYNQKQSSLEQFKNWLPKNNTALYYYYTKEAFYVISINKENSLFQKLPLNDTINAQIIQLASLVSNPNSNKKQLQTISNNVYKQLVAPTNIDPSTSHLIIMPDGPLRTIPFESLLNNENQYLIETYSCSYTNSATLLNRLQTTKLYNDKMMAFAPNFEQTELSNLPNNINESLAVSKYFPGKLFNNKEATLSNFIKNAADYSIIHLATHAITNNEFPEFSYLAFSKENNTENLLYINDLYNHTIHADLVTLSACESGIGALKAGEGFISLSRAFFYSGAKALLHTMWNINDASSSTMMELFYTYLEQGNTKDKALQLAKKQFLDQNKENNLSHPYYWSAFVIHGNTNPLKPRTNGLWYLFGAGFSGLFLVLFRKNLFYFFKK